MFKNESDQKHSPIAKELKGNTSEFIALTEGLSLEESFINSLAHTPSCDIELMPELNGRLSLNHTAADDRGLILPYKN
jgi:hypothetical protein